MSPLVKMQRSGPVVTLILNRPERHNSLVPGLLVDLLIALDDLRDDGAVRAVVVAAEGKTFSTGGDVKAFFAAGPEVADYATETVGLLNEVIVAMLRLPQPIVTAVHGMVTGGSIGLLLASDVVLMAPEATITPWYSAVGFSPDGGWTALLPDVIGRHHTARLLLANEAITADDAVAWGLATEIAPPATIRERAGTVAKSIASMEPGSVASTKTLLNRDHRAVAMALEAERREFVRQIATSEARRGMAAFLGRER